MNGFCDIIENRGALLRSDRHGFEVEIDVAPVFRSIGPAVVDLLTSAFPVSEQGLVTREALLSLSAVPLHARPTPSRSTRSSRGHRAPRRRRVPFVMLLPVSCQ